MRTEDVGVGFSIIRWVRNTDFYIAANTNTKVIRGQISEQNQSSLRNLGISPTVSGYFINAEVNYLMLSGDKEIKFVDHVAIYSSTGNVSSSSVSMDQIVMATSGFEDTNYFYAITFGNTEVPIYNYNPSGHTIWKNIDLSQTNGTTMLGSHIPNSSVLFVVYYCSGEYEIAVVDYSKNSGEELLRSYTMSAIPKIMVGLNSLTYIIFGYSPYGIDFRNEYNTRMWFNEASGTKIEEIDVSPDDNLFIYGGNSNYMIIMASKNPDPPLTICNYYKQVKVGQNCVDCLEHEQFLQSTSACNGASNDGENRFVDTKFTFVESETIEDTGKTRYSIKFQAINYSNTGSGNGFSGYDLESNIQIDPPVGYMITIFDFQKDDQTYSGEFRIEITPEIPEGKVLPIAFSLKKKQIGDGGANDPVLFIQKSEIINFTNVHGTEFNTTSTTNTTTTTTNEEAAVSSFLDSPISTNAATTGKIFVISSSVS